MTAKLLCCVNASAHARPAIELSTEIAKGLGRRLVFLLVNQTRPASGYPDIRAMSESEARDVLDVALRYAETQGVQDARTALIEARDVADAILGFADEQEFGHIVLGKGNPPFIGRLLLGSVSEAVVTRAKCSVTVAR